MDENVIKEEKQRKRGEKDEKKRKRRKQKIREKTAEILFNPL